MQSHCPHRINGIGDLFWVAFELKIAVKVVVCDYSDIFREVQFSETNCFLNLRLCLELR